MMIQNRAFNVEGIIDEDTSNTIKNAIVQLNGVFDAVVYIDAKRVTVEYDEERLSEEIIRGTIEDAGFIVK